MRYVADTHALLAALGDRRKLGARALRVLERAARGSAEVFVSVVTLWEVALLAERRRVQLPSGYTAWAAAVRRLPGVNVEPLVSDDVEHARAFPILVDPADRLIVGTALRLQATLITRDERITKSGAVPVLW